MTRVYETMRQLNKKWTLVINVIKPESEITMKILSLDSGKPSVHNRTSGLSGCSVMACFPSCDDGLSC